MKPHGTYKIRYQRNSAANPPQHAPSSAPRALEPLEPLQPQEPSDPADGVDALLARIEHVEARTQRVVDSVREELLAGGDAATLRVRRVFQTPREIFRLELERPDLGYQRTLLVGRAALEALLEHDHVRNALENVAA